MYCPKCGNPNTEESEFCAYCGESMNASNSKGGTVKVVFVRQKNFVGSLVPMYIHLDKNKVATLKNGESYEMEIPCGVHSVIVDMWSATSETQINFTSNYGKIEIMVGIQMGMVTNKANILYIRDENKNNIMNDVVVKSTIQANQVDKNEGPIVDSNNKADTNNVIQEDDTAPKKTNGTAIGGLICSILGLFIAGIILGIFGITMGIAAKNHIKMFKNEKGNGIATAAIVIGIIDIVGIILNMIIKICFEL